MKRNHSSRFKIGLIRKISQAVDLACEDLLKEMFLRRSERVTVPAERLRVGAGGPRPYNINSDYVVVLG
jgi:hypothetical protein